MQSVTTSRGPSVGVPELEAMPELPELLSVPGVAPSPYVRSGTELHAPKTRVRLATTIETAAKVKPRTARS